MSWENLHDEILEEFEDLSSRRKHPVEYQDRDKFRRFLNQGLRVHRNENKFDELVFMLPLWWKQQEEHESRLRAKLKEKPPTVLPRKKPSQRRPPRQIMTLEERTAHNQTRTAHHWDLRGRVWNPEKEELLISLYIAGVSWPDISVRLGVKLSTCQTHLCDLKVRRGLGNLHQLRKVAA